VETGYQLIPDGFRLAAFDPGCSLQVALGVKREWKQRNDRDKDYPGHPKTAHMHKNDDAITAKQKSSSLPAPIGFGR
jgi:hypothetical protein